MVDGITIRLAGADDVDVIVHHRRAMFVAMMGTPDAAALAAMDVAFVPYLRRTLADGSYRGWLACTPDGRVVAGGGLIVHDWFASPANPDPRRAYVLNLYTEPEYRHRGIARRIMEAILGWCREHGFRRVSLHASRYGRALYESLGFAPTNEMTLRLDAT
jgi:GNAT superfamily N-acetyltransferase